MENTAATHDESNAAKKKLATVVYALQAAGFIVGITMIAAVVINCVKRDEVRGTWLESHFRWQTRIFWFALLWGVVGIATAFFFVGYVVLVANAIWVIYRIVKGWLCLSENKKNVRMSDFCTGRMQPLGATRFAFCRGEERQPCR